MHMREPPFLSHAPSPPVEKIWCGWTQVIKRGSDAPSDIGKVDLEWLTLSSWRTIDCGQGIKQVLTQ